VYVCSTVSVAGSSDGGAPAFSFGVRDDVSNASTTPASPPRIRRSRNATRAAAMATGRSTEKRLMLRYLPGMTQM
jgi:hypothetical protein